MWIWIFQVDLVGGYYDAGDNVKFGLPMAFTTTLLAWSVIEFGTSMQNQVENAKAALRWSTDYLLKAATSTPGTLYVQVRQYHHISVHSLTSNLNFFHIPISVFPASSGLQAQRYI